MRQIQDLPHPPYKFLLGNAGAMPRHQVHLQVEGYAKQYGKLFRMKFGPREFVVLADHELIGQILRERPETFGRNPASRQVSRELGLPMGLFSAEGEQWRAQRRMVMAAFAPGHIRAYFPQMARVTQRLQQRWLASQGQSLVVGDELMRYTVDTIAGLALGEDINTLGAGEDRIQQHLDKLLPAIFKRATALVPIWRWFKTAKDRDLERSVQVIKAEVQRFIAQAQAQMAAEPALREQPKNLLQAMILAAEADTGITDGNVEGNVLTMLLAGEDTTANTIGWLINLFHLHPQHQQRAREELAERLGERAADPLAYTPELLDSLPWLEACLHEAMRLKPVAPFMPIQALKDTTVGDVAVPAGTLVWCVLRHDSVGEPHFQQPLAFDPARWLGENTGSAKRVAMPFGAGPRMCPGRYLALLEMKLAMAMLLGRFAIEEVRMPDGTPEAPEALYFTMAPKGLTMRLRALA